jgi:hypothetical protein
MSMNRRSLLCPLYRPYREVKQDVADPSLKILFLSRKSICTTRYMVNETARQLNDPGFDLKPVSWRLGIDTATQREAEWRW